MARRDASLATEGVPMSEDDANAHEVKVEVSEESQPVPGVRRRVRQVTPVAKKVEKPEAHVPTSEGRGGAFRINEHGKRVPA